MQDANIQVSSTLVTWILGSLGSLVLFFIGLGAKNLKDQLQEIPQLRLEIQKLRGETELMNERLISEVAKIRQRMELEFDK